MESESIKPVRGSLARFAAVGRCLASHRGLVILLVGAFMLRLAVALTMDSGFGDQQEYLSGANRLLDGQPLPTLNNMSFVRQPGYSLFIAAVWWLSPARSILVIKLAQAALSTLTCLIAYGFTKIIGQGERSALVATAVTAAYPYFLFQVSAVGTECLFAFLLALGTYFLARGFKKEFVRWSDVGAGVVIYALGMLVRPNLAPTEALLGLFIAWRYRRRLRTVFGSACLMIAATLAVTVPWSVAVDRQGLGHVFLSDGGGAWYYVGHRNFAVRIYCEHEVGKSEELDPALLAVRTLPRSEQARFYWRTALHWDREHLSDQWCLAAGKFWNYWRPWVEPHVYSRILFGISLLSFPLLTLGLMGLWRLRSDESGGAMVVCANVLGGAITAMVYSTQIRYRIPVVDVLLAPYAACMITEAVRRWEAVWGGARAMAS